MTAVLLPLSTFSVRASHFLLLSKLTTTVISEDGARSADSLADGSRGPSTSTLLAHNSIWDCYAVSRRLANLHFSPRLGRHIAVSVLLDLRCLTFFLLSFSIFICINRFNRSCFTAFGVHFNSHVVHVVVGRSATLLRLHLRAAILERNPDPQRDNVLQLVPSLRLPLLLSILLRPLRYLQRSLRPIGGTVSSSPIR